MEQIRDFTEGFFKNLKCTVHWELLDNTGNWIVVENGNSVNAVLVVEDVPKSFEDLFGKTSPYKISFVSGVDGCDFIGKGSVLLSAITKFLEGTGKTTLLKIDFDCDPETEINKAISLKNCEINNIVKRHKNNFFSRFTFVTTFSYMNTTKQFVNEIYVHDGKIVKGNLDGYTVLEGKNSKAVVYNIKEDYNIARIELKKILDKNSKKIEENLEKKLEQEVGRVRWHYKKLLDELGGHLSETIKKVHKTELDIRTSDDDTTGVLITKLRRLKKELVKSGDDDSKKRILKEQEFTINDVMQKYSLNINNKLVNTTVIYYPVFGFNLFIKNDSSGRFVKIDYDPLIKKLNKLNCESCGEEITKLNLCSGGHISCDNCLEKCGECGKPFCKKCLKKNCSLCGKKLCKSCLRVCRGCGKYICKDHIRKDCVSGENRCSACLRACLRCHGLSSEKYFGEALDGSKICQKCLGEERRKNVMKKIFRD